jgi:hypothetical protein
MRVRLEYGDSLVIGDLSPYASVSRSGGDFSIKCDEVLSASPKDNSFICEVRK